MKNTLILVLFALFLSSGASADDAITGEVDLSRATSVLEEIKLNIAAVAWNEASVRATRDEARAIFHVAWTVAGGSRATPERVLRAQRLLSKRITGVRPALDIGNERWSRNLRWSDEEPDGWEVTGIPWSRRRGRWETMRRVIDVWVDQHFAGHVHRQCDGTPRGWGGPLVDEGHLRARNAARRERGRPEFLVLDCGNTANGFFGIPRRGSRTRQTLSAVTIVAAPES